MAYETKTKETDIAVNAFLNAVADERQRNDAHKIIAMMQRLTGLPPQNVGAVDYQFWRTPLQI